MEMSILNNWVLGLVALEVLPVLYMLHMGSKALHEKMLIQKEKVLQRCTYDVKYRNRIASILFFFADMGPNVSSFSVIALFITTEEKWGILVIVFFFGILMKELFRELKNKFYGEIEKRSS
jgi:hypothetical protein